MTKKIDKIDKFDITDAELKALQEITCEEFFDFAVDSKTDESVEKYHSSSPNSYAFWGPETAKIVKTPASLYLPISFDAFKLSCAGYDLEKQMNRRKFPELFSVASKILDWTKKQGIDEFFLKNAIFSGKHRWPFTCNVDMSYIPKENDNARLGKILTHMNNINDYSSLVMANPGLGFLARKKLETTPFFYAFGSVFYKLTDKTTGKYQVRELTGHKGFQDEIIKMTQSNPNLEYEKFHIGMPITKELRVLVIDGKVIGSAPYWAKLSFEDQIVYDKDGNELDDISKQKYIENLNKIEQSDLNYLTSETQKIANHEKFHKLDWAIDWLQTKDNGWYMIDMQLLETSYVDFANIKYVDDESKKAFCNVMYNKWQNLETLKSKMDKKTLAFFKLFNTIFGKDGMNVEKRLKSFGYPSIAEIKLLHNKYNGR